MRDELILISLLLLLVMASISIGFMAKDDINSLIRKIKNEQIENPEQCSNLSLIETAHCLNDYVCSIFKYKERQDLEKPTLKELKEEGGDCKNWAEFYINHAEELGFNVKMPIIDMGDKIRHTFAIISDETGYCKLDQMSLDCFLFED